MTLPELLKDKALPIKVRKVKWSKDEYIEIHVFTEKAFLGFDQINELWCERFETLRPGSWELYTKPKTVLYEYLVDKGAGYSLMFYESDQVFEKHWPRFLIIKTGRSIELELP